MRFSAFIVNVGYIKMHVAHQFYTFFFQQKMFGILEYDLVYF